MNENFRWDPASQTETGYYDEWVAWVTLNYLWEYAKQRAQMDTYRDGDMSDAVDTADDPEAS